MLRTVPQTVSWGQGFEQNIARAAQIVRPLAARRVVERDAEIACRRAAQPLLDFIPRSQQVGQADAREVAGER